MSLCRNPLFIVWFSINAVLCTECSEAADSAKVKVLESCNFIDPRALRVLEAKVKAVTTQDPEHRKVIEVVMDYAKAGVGAGFGKKFPEGLNLKKYSAIRFWVRSDSSTSFAFGMSGHYKRKDGRATDFGAGYFKASDTWTQISIPLDKFKRSRSRFWDKEKQAPVEVPGGDPLDDEDFEGIESWGIGSDINGRGTSTKGHLMFDAFEIVEK